MLSYWPWRNILPCYREGHRAKNSRKPLGPEPHPGSWLKRKWGPAAIRNWILPTTTWSRKKTQSPRKERSLANISHSVLWDPDTESVLLPCRNCEIINKGCYFKPPCKPLCYMAIENLNRLAFIPVSLSLGLSSRATNSAYPTHCASTTVPEFPSGEPRFSISWACLWFLVRKLFIVLISWGLRPCFDLNTQLFSQSLHKLTWPFPFLPTTLTATLSFTSPGSPFL